MEELIRQKERQIKIYTSIFSLLVGTVIVLLSVFAFEAMVRIFFVCVGIGVVLVNLIPFIIATQLVSRDKRYVLDLILSLLAIILGVLFIFEQGHAVSIVFSIYLVLMPIIRIALASDKLRRLKKELPLFIIAILLFFNVFDDILRIALIVIGGLLALLGLVNLILALISKGSNNENNNYPDMFVEDDRVIIDAEVKDL